MAAKTRSRIVLVHDWLTGMRGGEKCLEVFCQHWPDAPLYTVLHRRGSVCATIEQHAIHTSRLNWLPGVQRYYRYLLPLLPLAAGWKAPDCDLVLSSSHCVAKSVQPPPGVPHVCYCFTPMRYAWHMQTSYFGDRKKSLKARALNLVLAALRQWDRATAQRVTHFVAISQTVQQRIRQCYGRESAVIYPPVNTDFYQPASVPREDYYLIVSAFAPYKRVDLAIEACNQLQKQLVIIGQGQTEKKLRAIAGPTIHFLGWQGNDSIRDHMRRCRALLFPGEEDFGIVPVEAMACGTPVIAYGRGGATETVVPPECAVQPTGLWFEEQTTSSLIQAMMRFEALAGNFDPAALRQQAQRFNQQRFADEIRTFVEDILHGRQDPFREHRAAA